jgi:hypothetical protein
LWVRRYPSEDALGDTLHAARRTGEFISSSRAHPRA